MAFPLLGAAAALPWKTILKWGLIIAVVVGIGVGAWKAVDTYNDTLRSNIQLTADKAQLEQSLEDKELLIEKMEELQDLSRDILADTANKNTTVIERHNRVVEYIESPEAQASNGPAADIIKNTVRMLKDEE